MQADSNRYMLVEGQLSLPTKLAYQETKRENQPQSAKHYAVSLQRTKENCTSEKYSNSQILVKILERQLSLSTQDT